MKYSWDDSFSLGIKEIDEQHQQFFKIYSQIYELPPAGTDHRFYLLKIISDFSDYALYHFSAEEEYFAKFKYPDADVHVQVHNSYRQKMKELIQKARQEDVDFYETCKDVGDFAINWLITHIKGMDRQYVQFFREHGIT